ncbi:hypothetical protein M4I21_12415 [Cellulophaga sp. 20_2_10]|uniref:hypothetical protein n=1 Tax=Cellulophaga sp. 20_2_10 TaxID=2942476 RepID=UPI00201AF204|nr:hypothetical protein [Cellulophaga sp. 20_2_10]MCL5246620.1 hypothetical protein [Cellulophaga sp. 20_2_10]
MKNTITVLVLSICTTFISCNSGDVLKYDFAEVKSSSQTKALIAKMQLENLEEDIDSTSSDHDITLKGMHYAGVPIKSASITDNYTLLTTDTINVSAKKLLEVLETEKGLTNPTEGFGDDIEFEWKDEIENKELEINFINGKHLAAFGNKDYARLTIKYNPLYTIPLAKIHEQVKVFDTAPKYLLNIKSYNCVFDIRINDINIAKNTNSESLNLNNYITGPNSSIVVTAKTKDKSRKKEQNTYYEDPIFSIEIIDDSTKEVVKTIEKTSIRNNNPVNLKIDFNTTLPYYPEAWTNGADLRNDKDLKEKVIALYTKLGNAILANDEQAINDLFYQKDFEMQQLDFDTNFETARNEWEAYLTILLHTYKYTVAKDFDLEFNAGGKLIYTYAKDKSDMLILTGKEYDKTFNHFLYQPKGSNELKIIR